MTRIMLFFLSLGIFFNSGCKSLMIAKFKINRPFDFKQSRNDYLKKVVKENRFRKDQLLYVDSIDLYKLNELYINWPSQAYFGTFVNDTLFIKKSEFLKEDELCTGRVEKEIKKNVVLSDYAVDSQPGVNLSNYRFYSLNENKRIFFSENDKKIKVILFYTYSSGTIYKKLYKHIERSLPKSSDRSELFVVSVDPVFHLRPDK